MGGTHPAPSASLYFATNGDDASDYLEATLAPVPAAFEVCSSFDAACNTTAQPSNAGAFRLAASEPTTLNLFECVQPLTGCTAANATASTAVSNLRARTVGLDVNVNGGVGVSSGNRVFFDTDNFELTGAILKKLPGARTVQLGLPSGFRAQNRFVTWDPGTFFNPSGITRSGTIVCPAGTVFHVGLVFGTIDVDSITC